MTTEESRPVLVPAAPPESAIVLWTRLVLGLTALGGDALADAMARAVGRPIPAPRPVVFAAGTAVGLALEAQRRALDAAGRVSAAMEPYARPAWRRLEPWYRLGVTEQRDNRGLADAFLRALVGKLALAVLAQLDLDEVAERVDVDRIVARVDVDRIVERLDLDAIVRRVDMEGLIRESTHTMADESVDALRLQSMNADRVVSSVVDRLLRRQPRQARLEP